MAAKPFAPPPPKRFSSKQTDVLQSVISKRQKFYEKNYNSRTSSVENLYHPSSYAVRIQNEEKSKPFDLKKFSKFRSCDDLQQLHNGDVDCVKHKKFRWPDSTHRMSNPADYFQSSPIKICDNYHATCFPHLLRSESTTGKQCSSSAVLGSPLNGNKTSLATSKSCTHHHHERSVLSRDTYPCRHHLKFDSIETSGGHSKSAFDLPLNGNKTSVASPDNCKHQNHAQSVVASSDTYPRHHHLDLVETSNRYSNSDLAQLNFFRRDQMQYAERSKATEQNTENLLHGSCPCDNVNKNINLRKTFLPKVNHNDTFIMFPEISKCFPSNIFNPERPENLVRSYNSDYNIMGKIDLDNSDRIIPKFDQSSSLSEMPRCIHWENADNGQSQTLLNGGDHQVNREVGNNCQKIIQKCESQNNFSENFQSICKNVEKIKRDLNHFESSQKISEQRNRPKIYCESRSSSINLRSIDFNRTETDISNKVSHFANNNVLGEHEIASKYLRKAKMYSAEINSNNQKTSCQMIVSNHNTSKIDCPQNIFNKSNSNNQETNCQMIMSNRNTSKSDCPQNILNKASCFEVPEIYTEKAFPRMITILPAVVHVSKIPAARLEPKVVHSEPLYTVKQICKVDLNPLKMYLKRFGQTLSQNANEPGLNLKSVALSTNGIYTFNDMSSNCYSRNNNGYVLGNQNCNYRKGNTNDLTYCSNITTVSEKFNANYLRPTNNISTNFSPRSIPSVQNNYWKHSTNDFQYIKNRKNVFMNQNHAAFYHNYISTMVQSVGKSRKFLYLLNFYSNLESSSSTNYANRAEFRVIKIKEFDMSWARSCTYQKWDRERDKNLRIKNSSVEDLRQLFDKSANVKKTSHKTTLQYRKFWYNVSVSNLIEKYDGKINSRENCQEKINSTACPNCVIENKFSSRNHPADVSENSIQDLFQNIPVSLYSQKQINFIECRSSHLINHPSCSNSVSSSCSDLRSGLHLTQDVRSKVQFYEDMSHTNSLKRNSSLCHLSPDSVNIGKFSHSRNLSWTDLRGIENSSSSTNNKSFFSPQYIPEKAMSCLDLTFASECSNSTAGPLSTHSNRGWASSTASCISQDSYDKHDVTHIRTIKTGTVSRIKNKLEKFIMSRSKSVPQNITSVTVCNSNNASTGSKLLTPSGSVHNLKKVFETSNNDPSSISNNHSSCSKKQLCSKGNFFSRWRFKETSVRRNDESYQKDVPRSEEVLNTCSRNIMVKSAAGYRNLVEEYMKNRIKSIISRFECENLRGYTKDFSNISKKSFNNVNVSSTYNCCTHKSSGITTTTLTELSFNTNNPTLSSTDLHSKIQHLPTTFQDNNQYVKSSFQSGNWMKLYFPRVTNSFPKPYQKKANNVICSPLKSRRPGLYRLMSS